MKTPFSIQFFLPLTIIFSQIIHQSTSAQIEIIPSQQIEFTKEYQLTFNISKQNTTFQQFFSKSPIVYIITKFTETPSTPPALYSPSPQNETKSSGINFSNTKGRPILVSGLHQASIFKLRSFHEFRPSTNKIPSYIKVDLENYLLERESFFTQSALEFHKEEETYGVLIYNTKTANGASYFSNVNSNSQIYGKLSVYISDIMECENQCSFNGLCFQGRCECFPGYYSFDCSQKSNMNFTVSMSSWMVQKIPLLNEDRYNIDDILITISTTQYLYALLMINGENRISFPSIEIEPYVTISPFREKTYNISHVVIIDYLDRIQKRADILGQTISPYFQLCLQLRSQPVPATSKNSSRENFNFTSEITRFSHVKNKDIDKAENQFHNFILMSFVAFVFLCACLLGMLIWNETKESERNSNLALMGGGNRQNDQQNQQQNRFKHNIPKTTLNAELIEKFMPTRKFSEMKEEFPNIEKINKECNICLETFEGEGFQDCKMTMCLHIFHSSCLSDWLRQHENCPFCRESLDLESLSDEKKANQYLLSKYASDLQIQICLTIEGNIILGEAEEKAIEISQKFQNIMDQNGQINRQSLQQFYIAHIHKEFQQMQNITINCEPKNTENMPSSTRQKRDLQEGNKSQSSEKNRKLNTPLSLKTQIQNATTEDLENMKQNTHIEIEIPFTVQNINNFSKNNNNNTSFPTVTIDGNSDADFIRRISDAALLCEQQETDKSQQLDRNFEIVGTFEEKKEKEEKEEKYNRNQVKSFGDESLIKYGEQEEQGQQGERDRGSEGMESTGCSEIYENLPSCLNSNETSRIDSPQNLIADQQQRFSFQKAKIPLLGGGEEEEQIKQRQGKLSYCENEAKNKGNSNQENLRYKNYSHNDEEMFSYFQQKENDLNQNNDNNYHNQF